MKDTRVFTTSPLSTAQAVAIAVLIAFFLGCIPFAAQAHAAQAEHVQAGDASLDAEAVTSYGIVYKLGGGELNPAAPTTVKAGETIKVKQIGNPTRDGYVFAGWFADAATKQAAAVVRGTESVADRTLYAKWKPRSYAVKYYLRGGKMLEKKVARYSTNKGIPKLPVAMRPGYTFMGWSFNAPNGDANSGIPKNTPDITRLYAVWQKKALIAHQGIAGTGVVKNSLDAFELAAEKGFALVETDIRFTADGVPVLAHDDKIAVRLRGLDGKPKGKAFYIRISKTKYSKLQNSYVAKTPRGSEVARRVLIWDAANKRYTVQKRVMRDNVAKLANFLDLCKDYGIRPYLELKAATKKQMKKLVLMVDKRKMTYSVTWASFSAGLLKEVRTYHPKASIAYIVNKLDAKHCIKAKELQRTGADMSISVKAKSAGRKTAKLCKSAKLPMQVWVLGTERTIPKYSAYISAFYVNAAKASSLQAK